MPRRGIATTYGGITYRSLLEARFAALFDGLKWTHNYEPAELDWYIPDFDLVFTKRPLLVEIKPLNEDIALAKEKIYRSGWTGDIAILISAETKFIGDIYESGIGWDRAVLTFCKACNSATIVSEGGRWSCRNCNGSNRDLWWAYDAASEWHEAQNATQWKGAAE